MGRKLFSRSRLGNIVCIVGDMPNYRIERFGTEQQAVVIIDDFFSEPDKLVSEAQAQSFSKQRPFYPGISAPANPVYLAENMNLLKKAIIEAFGFSRGMSLVDCNYSLVTTRPEHLLPIQSLPHYDGVDPGRLAVLHYLCGKDKGGTGFFRHNATGFETVTKTRFQAYKSTLETEIREEGLPPKSYINETTRQFEKIGEVTASFNRCIIYRSIMLHSGLIPDDFLYEKNPKNGRLSVNTFLQAK
mgnify:CR=1 FL=1